LARFEQLLYLGAAAEQAAVVAALADKPVVGKADQALVRIVGSQDKVVAEVAVGSLDVEDSLAAELDIQDTLAVVEDNLVVVEDNQVVVEDNQVVVEGTLVEELDAERLAHTPSELVQLVVQESAQQRSQTQRELFACPLRTVGRLLPALIGRLLFLKKMLAFFKYLESNLELPFLLVPFAPSLQLPS